MNDFLSWLRNIVAECQKLEQLEGCQKIVTAMLHYALSRGCLESKEAFLKFVSKEFGQERGAEMMTLAEQLRAEGFQEGERLGEKRGEKLGEKKGMVRTKLEMAVKLIAEGLDLSVVAKVTELPMSQLQELAGSSVE